MEIHEWKIVRRGCIHDAVQFAIIALPYTKGALNSMDDMLYCNLNVKNIFTGKGRFCSAMILHKKQKHITMGMHS